MLLEERRQKIVKELRKHGKVKVNNLAKELKVSSMTIRRDLSDLEERGLAVRTRGGAVYPDTLNYEPPYKSKKMKNIEEKKRIGKKAAELISKGQSILLDAGTTSLAVAQKIKSKQDITVITNDIRIALELYNNPDIELISTGGFIQPKVGAMIGNYTEEMIESMNVDIAFVGVSAIDANYSLSTPTARKAFLKKMMIQNSNRSVLLADSSKYDKKSLHKICNLQDIDVWITDTALHQEVRQEIESLIPKLILA